MILIAVVFTVIYILMLLTLVVIWSTFTVKYSDKISTEFPKITIIVPVRNEANNILVLLQSIDSQSLDKEKYEVILIDDNSSDDTVELILNFKKSSKLTLKLLKLEHIEGQSYKKSAISQGITASNGSLIFATDGDCILPPLLLAKYQLQFLNSDLHFISGPVSFKTPKDSILTKIWVKIQTIEFASLVGTAACSIAINRPNMCSGANICYRKSSFLAVNGYEGNMQIASGDDEFLMHKIANKFRNSVRFMKDSSCVVLTNSSSTLTEFYHQRLRWASKWSSRKSLLTSGLAVFVFIASLSFIFILFTEYWFIAVLRCLFELIFLGLVLSFFRKTNHIFFIPLVQLLYPFYVVFIAFSVLLPNKSYIWKDRKLNK